MRPIYMKELNILSKRFNKIMYFSFNLRSLRLMFVHYPYLRLEQKELRESLSLPGDQE